MAALPVEALYMGGAYEVDSQIIGRRCWMHTSHSFSLISYVMDILLFHRLQVSAALLACYHSKYAHA